MYGSIFKLLSFRPFVNDMVTSHLPLEIPLICFSMIYYAWLGSTALSLESVFNSHISNEFLSDSLDMMLLHVHVDSSSTFSFCTEYTVDSTAV